MKPILSQAAVRRFALAWTAKNRPGWKPTRVAPEWGTALEWKARRLIVELRGPKNAMQEQAPETLLHPDEAGRLLLAALDVRVRRAIIGSLHSHPSCGVTIREQVF